MPTIESLELSIQANSESAKNGIDSLSVSLLKLRSALKGGIGLTSINSQLQGLSESLNLLNESSIGKINSISDSLLKLSSLEKIKISASIGNQLRNIGESLSLIDETSYQKLERIVPTLQSLGSIKKASGLNSTINTLKKLPELASAFKGIDWKTLDVQFARLATSLSPLAKQLSVISGAFNNLPTKIQRLTNVSTKLAKTNESVSHGYMNLWAKFSLASNAIRTGGRTVAKWVAEANKYIEDLNLFTVSMGEYAESAKEYAEKAGEALGIDPAEWMRNQGIFNTIITGFGVGADKAAKMSKNLTQLGYDISSFYNISFNESMQKLASGIAGELEPLRRIGYDLSIARLQQEAYALGINKTVSSMTQAEKSMLRYHAIMTQVKVVQGDMARTLESPSNQLRILHAQVIQVGRALGMLFLPLLKTVVAWAIALAKVIRTLIGVFLGLFGIKQPKMDAFSAGAGAVGGMADNAERTGKGMGKAAKEAKKMKDYLLGIDELNVIRPEDPTQNSGGGGGGGIGGGGGLDFPLEEYTMFSEELSNKFDALKNKLLDWLQINDNISTWSELVETRFWKILKHTIAIGTALATWKISKPVIAFIDKIGKGFKALDIAKLGGLSAIFSDLIIFMEALEDLVAGKGDKNSNLHKLFNSFSGLFADMLAISGKTQLAGAIQLLTSISELVRIIGDISRNGFTSDNAVDIIRLIGRVLIAASWLGIISGQWVGVGLILNGVAIIFKNLDSLIKAIKTGDFSKVNKTEVVEGALLTIAGIFIAFSKFKKVIDAHKNVKGVTDALEKATEGTKELGDTISGKVSPRLLSLAKNLGLGVAIIAEVAVSALLIIGSIVLMGMLLEQVGKAWQPVIDNSETIITAMIAGGIFLGVVGAATALIGQAGMSLITNIAIGEAVLLLSAVATATFIASIWAIGLGFQEIINAWTPVIANEETLKLALTDGTIALTAIAAIIGGIGAISVATGGLLHVAIAAGASAIVLILISIESFVTETTNIADKLSNELAPKLDELNEQLPDLKTNMDDFTTYMGDFCDKVVEYSKSSIGASFTGAIKTIVDWLLGDPLTNFSNDIIKIKEKADTIDTDIDDVSLVLSGLPTKIDTYSTALQSVADKGAVKVEWPEVLFEGYDPKKIQDMQNNIYWSGQHATWTNEKTLATALPALQTLDTNLGDYKTAFDNIETTSSSTLEWAETPFVGYDSEKIKGLQGYIISASDVTTLNDNVSKTNDELKIAVEFLSTYTRLLDKISNLTKATNISKLATGTFVDLKMIGTNIVTGFVEGMKSKANEFSTVALELMDGFVSSIEINKDKGRTSIVAWGNNIHTWFTQNSNGNINRDAFTKYGRDIVEGFSSGINGATDTVRNAISNVASTAKNTFSNSVNRNVFKQIGKDVVSGFNQGISSSYTSSYGPMATWADYVKMVFKSRIRSNSPSKVFMGIGRDTVEGYNIGISEGAYSTEKTISKWTDSFTNIQPKMRLALDTSALSYYNENDFNKSFSQDLYASNNVFATGIKEGLAEFYNEYVAPMVTQMANDMHIQANKPEKTIVKIGTKEIAREVSAQKAADGYLFRG